MQTRRIAAAVAIIIWALFIFPDSPAFAAEPLKVGFTLPLSGAAAPSGKQVLFALQLWRDDLNAKGGLLGQPVELVYYDDQGNAAKVPPLYRKLLSADKVALIIGPYATNTAAAAMRMIMEFNRATISILAFGVNRIFSYRRYFALAPAGLEGVKAFQKGFFELAAEQKPKPQTVALLAANTEFDRTVADGARENAKAKDFSVVYDVTYPASNTDFTSTAREMPAANADLVFVSSRQPDAERILRAANEVGLMPKMFGGILPKLRTALIKAQLDPLLDGVITTEIYVPASTLDFPASPICLSVTVPRLRRSN
jgi:branched-chain amino acid transport system substrate-binding protein